MSENNSPKVAVKNSLLSLIQHFNAEGDTQTINQSLSDILFNTDLDFLSRSKQLREWTDAHPAFADLEDVLFDMLMVHYLAAEQHPEDYFDSQEWESIENKTINMGSEMLTLFLYLSEAKEAGVEVSLDDFLNEFLLTGEEEGQEEYSIYESLIVNEQILDADHESIRKLQEKMKSDNVLKPYFLPIVMFFQHKEGATDEEIFSGPMSPFEKAVLKTLITFSEN